MSIGPAKDKNGKWKSCVLDEPLMSYCPICKRYYPAKKFDKHMQKHKVI